MRRNVLVVAAHPDDEVLGCGATIAGHARRGDMVNVVIMAEGITSRKDESEIKIRKELQELTESAYKASKILGVSSLDLCGLPDNRLDSLQLLDVIQIIEGFIEKYNPEIVYTHHPGDVNIDHRRVHEAVVTACRPLPRNNVKTLLFFEIPSNTEWQVPTAASIFAPNWYVDVTDTINLKLEAIKEYKSEVRDWPHPRSLQAIEFLARWRGACISVDAAEAFFLGRYIEYK